MGMSNQTPVDTDIYVGRFVWLDVLPAYPHADVEVHRIVGVSVREDPAGVDNEVFLLVHGHGHDSEIENWFGAGEPMVHTGTEAPAGRLLCRTCFPEAYRE